MKKLDIEKVISEIRNCSVKRNEERCIFPYLEMYPKIKRKDKDGKNWDGKQRLMQNVRDRIQGLINPYDHKRTLNKTEFEVVLPRILNKEQELKGYREEPVIRKRLACHSVTPRKKNLLFYHLSVDHYN